ncbi:sugar porter family MFS transporter [Mycobacterium sp. pUA109]|uniref:sugar porter family MFS transporter n=1 Tax=Mycobacterium sp. pUA109 TaxID=3238982 RepID=UPI00351ADC2B
MTSGPPSARTAVRVAAVAALGGLIFGYDVSLINSAVGAVQDAFRVGNALLGFAAAASLLGGMVGALTTGWIADRAGRRAAMMLAAALFLVGALGAGLATGIGPLIGCRLVAGLGIGVASVVTPAYIAEISPPHIRGRLGTLQQLAIVSGILAALVVDWLLAELAGGSGGVLWLGLPAWRWMFLGEVAPALLYGVLVGTIPESPRHLIAVHRIPEARRVIAGLFGAANVDATVERIAQTLRHEAPPSWRDLRRPAGGLYPIVWVGLGLAIFQQFVGINVIFFYSKVLWQAVGFDEGASFAIAVSTAAVNVLITVVAIGLIDRVGRRPLLLAGSAGMAAMLATLTLTFATAPVLDGKPHLVGVSGPIALVAANVFVIAFAVSWGPILWVLLGEMFPNRIRAAALGLAVAAQWVANWVIAASFPALRDALPFAYGFYTANAMGSWLFVWRWVRETKGVALEDMPEHG